MSYSGLAKTILQLVGGAIVMQCKTQTRRTMHQGIDILCTAKKTELQNLDGVLSVVESGGQFQVIVGSHVSHVYKELMNLLSGGQQQCAT